MFYGDKVQDTRQFFFQSWQKYLDKQELTSLEQQIVAVIIEHPEYHQIFASPLASLDKSYFPEMGESNPFFHLGLHLALRDQIHLDRPQGIKEIYQSLQVKYQDNTEVEHLMMECLAECLWLASQKQAFPDEAGYLLALEKLTHKK